MAPERLLFGIFPKRYEKYSIAASILLVAIVCTAPVSFFSTLCHVFWTAVGVIIGVGIGLGLAMHVYEQLQQMSNAQKADRWSKRRTTAENIRPKATSRQTSNMLEDGNSYFSLMASAGYSLDHKVLRGQVIRENDKFWELKYRFTDVRVEEQMAPDLMKEDWPNLPPPVATELGRFIEHVMRDYVAGWYCKVDGGCVFKDEREKRASGIPRDGGEKPKTDNQAGGGQRENEENGGTEEAGHRADKKEKDKQPANQIYRKMVFTTKAHRRIPMLSETYR